MEKVIEKFKLIIEEGTVSHKRIKYLKKYIDAVEQNVKDIIESLEEGDVDENTIEQMKSIVNPEEHIDEIVSTQIKVEEIEKELDSHVKKYCGFSDKKPMDYVGYDNAQQKFVMRYDHKTRTGKDIEVVCKKTIEILKGKFDNGITEIVFFNKVIITYKNKNLLMYTTQKEILFDIYHIISILDIDKSMTDKKYKEFSSKITHFICAKNEYGGYIIRELIPEEVMYEIILSSNSAFSKSFKKDVSKMIDNIKSKGLENTQQLIPIQPIVVDEQQLSNNEIIEPVTDVVVSMTPDEIMEKLDVDAGYKISKEHPMEGVAYEKDRDKYDCVVDGKHTRSIHVKKVCEIKKNDILGKISSSTGKISQVSKHLINYQNTSILSLWHKHGEDIDPLFDIKHILKLLDVKTSQMYSIMGQIKDENKYIYFDPNKYDGYTVRELIDEKTMYQIVLDSRSKFSQAFKSDISDLLINLRKSGVIQFMDTSQRQRRMTISHYDDPTLFVTDTTNIGMKTNNEEHMKYINELITNGKEIRIQKYSREHILYFFITDIKYEDYVICKIGYTSNLTDRINSLPTEYEGSIFHLIGVKRIKDEHKEKKFHSLIKHRYPQLQYNGIELNDTRKTELYIFDKCLLEEFNDIKDEQHHTSHESIPLHELIEKSVKLGLVGDVLKAVIDAYAKEMELKKVRAELELQKLKM